MSTVACCSCAIEITGEDNRQSHYRSPWHRYNVKRKCLGLAPVPETMFQEKLGEVSADTAMPPKTKIALCCDACRSTFKSQKAYAQHLESKKHKKTALKFEEFPTPVKSIGETKEVKVVAEAKPIEIGTCLFCGHVNANLEDSINHMVSEHGFHVPFPDSCVDVEGLISYLGYKLGVGHVCPTCNGRGRYCFQSLEGLRQHIVDKGHYSIYWDEEDPEFEFDEFYEFEMKEPNVVDINEIGELILKSGKVIGSREMNVYYKQNVGMETELDRRDQRYLENKFAGGQDLAILKSRVHLELSTNLRRSAMQKWAPIPDKQHNREVMKHRLRREVNNNKMMTYFVERSLF